MIRITVLVPIKGVMSGRVAVIDAPVSLLLESARAEGRERFVAETNEWTLVIQEEKDTPRASGIHRFWYWLKG